MSMTESSEGSGHGSAGGPTGVAMSESWTR